MKNFDINMNSYVINCDIHKKRMDKFKKNARKEGLNYKRFSCIKGNTFTDDVICKMIDNNLIAKTADMNPIEVAINLSHLSVWEISLKNGDDYALVLEDDIKLMPNFIKKVNIILNSLIAENIDFSILYLYNGNWGRTKSKLKNVTYIPELNLHIKQETKPYNAGGAAYIISREFMNYMKSIYFPIKHPQDVLIGEKYKKGRHLTIDTQYLEHGSCAIPNIVGHDCGGEQGTGSTTQNRHLDDIKDKKCKLPIKKNN